MTGRPHSERTLALAFFIAVLATAVSCAGKEEQPRSLNFRQATGSLTFQGEAKPTELQLTSDDTAFFGAPNNEEKTNGLEVSLRSADNSLWLSMQILNVRTTRIYSLDSQVEGRVTLLVGTACDGAMGDLLGDSCDWYSSDFFQDGCWAALRTLTETAIQVDIECRALGALCSDGSGLQSPMPICNDGRQMKTVGFTATFRLEEPTSN